MSLIRRCSFRLRHQPSPRLWPTRGFGGQAVVWNPFIVTSHMSSGRCSSVVEHLHGKEVVTGSIPVSGSSLRSPAGSFGRQASLCQDCNSPFCSTFVLRNKNMPTGGSGGRGADSSFRSCYRDVGSGCAVRSVTRRGCPLPSFCFPGRAVFFLKDGTNLTNPIHLLGKGFIHLSPAGKTTSRCWKEHLCRGYNIFQILYIFLISTISPPPPRITSAPPA